MTAAEKKQLADWKAAAADWKRAAKMWEARALKAEDSLRGLVGAADKLVTGILKGSE